MFDYFCIFTTGGVVLWYKAFVEMQFDLINQLIKDIMIEEKSAKSQFITKGNIIKWKVANELNIIFTVVYKEVLHLSFVDDLLDLIKNEFIRNIYPTLDLDHGLYQTLPNYFDKNFKQIQAKWETKTQEMKSRKKMRTFNESKKNKKPKKIAKEIEKSSDDEEEVKEVDESKLTKSELARKKLADKFKKKKSLKNKTKKIEPKDQGKVKGKEDRNWGYKTSLTKDDLTKFDK